jgi:hypothetical protein
LPGRLVGWLLDFSASQGVEPEIQHVLDLHKDQIRHMQERFQQLVQQSDARAEQHYCQKLSQIDQANLQRMEEVRRQERDLAEHV